MSAGDVCVVSEDGPESLPLIVRPKDGNSSVEFIKRWVSDNKDWIDEKLLEHGSCMLHPHRHCTRACMYAHGSSQARQCMRISKRHS